MGKSRAGSSRVGRQSRYDFFEGHFAVDSSQAGSLTSWSNTFTGVSLPSWRQIIKRAGNATTAANGEYIEVVPSNIVVQIGGQARETLTEPWRRRYVNFSGDLINTGQPGTNFSLGTGSVDSRARIDFLNEFREARTAFQGGTFFGELAETVRMLKRPAKALRDRIDLYYGAVRERLRREKSRHRYDRVAADTWLEYSFGWSPLVHDIGDAFTALAHSRPHDLMRLRGYAEDGSSSYTGLGSVALSLGTFVYRLRRHESVSARYLGAIRASESGSYLDTLDTWGFSSDNFVPTVYNLIPWSFLVDYFSNIGDLIDAKSIRHCGLAWGCRTYRNQISWHLDTASVLVDVGDPNFRRNMGVETFARASEPTSKATRFSREPIQEVTVSLSDVSFRIPGVDNPRRWLNIASLASLRSIRAP